MASTGGDHALNIRVMRLSQPSFAARTPLVQEQNSMFPGFSDSGYLDGFGLGMALIVPQTFGMVYVGEDFSCLVSVFNESSNRVASDISIKAELQTQSQRTTLEEVVPVEQKKLNPGERFDTVIKSRLNDTGKVVYIFVHSLLISLFSRSTYIGLFYSIFHWNRKVSIQKVFSF